MSSFRLVRRAGVVLLVAALVSACGSEKDTGVTLEVAHTTTGDQTSTSAPRETPNPAVLADVPGALVYAQGHTLYQYPRGDALEPVMLSDDLDIESLAFTPEHDAMLYSKTEGTDRGIYLLELDTLDVVQLTDTFYFVASLHTAEWSPDGQWVILTIGAMGKKLVSRDGAQFFHLAGLTTVQSFWLDDGSILIIDARPEGLPPVEVYRAVSRFIPSTGETVPLDVDLAALASDASGIIDALAALGVDFVQSPAPSDIYIVPPESAMSGSTAACDDWSIDRFTDTGDDVLREPLYSVQDTYRLSDLWTLDDGSLVFLEWRIPDCRMINRPEVTLKHLVPGAGDAETLAGGVFSGVGLGQTGSPSYTALSPDGRYVAWIGGSLDTGDSSLNLIDTHTGATTLLMRETNTSGLDSTFIDGQMFSAVYWRWP